MLSQIQNDNNTDQVTMVSLELVDYINDSRKFDEKPVQLRHADFMAKVPKVLGGELSEKFRSVYTDTTGRTLPCYRFPKREACLMAMSYSYELQAQVFDRMTAMEQHIAAQNLPSYAIEDPIERAKKWIEEEKQKQAAIQQLELAAPKVQYFDRVADTKNLLNASQVGKKVGMSAVKLNQYLADMGVYDRRIAGRTFAQWFIDKGYGEVKQTEQGYPQSKFTNKGEQWVIEQLVSEGVVQ
ncbi:phage antirepressor KilAC domain-containing protein [Acinetobacter baumannii]|nr:phage antirepressor KilAC domain-containing protein [Acinetobacter baumannii]QTK45347.1 phage antirepressor KilAC domain-containing protein [Acinetobacter baumannii]QTK53568.1 phage antirepressor KilAC domain-containing protein [Acinetobacter baumannii]QTK57651.1 phage antirepressor KilAC domain-containing protein [Acinetobacter baumannii]QTK61736.1 phage antirepressor KilAC domain-containing protein [Acinetobacter baumannii]